jgi:LmbE family N-acetylglucosaminyl deacetylase
LAGHDHATFPDHSTEVMAMNGLGSASRLLAVFAHPDDEVFCAGGTMARAVEAGAEVLIVSATRGEQGQIRDPAAATRRTLGDVRESELRAAAAELGVQGVEMLGYPDGALQNYRSSLRGAITDTMRHFDPDAIVTFGADGAYGHPDHVAVSELTGMSFRAMTRGHDRGQELYHAVFPARYTSMAEELAHWIVESGQRNSDLAALQAITLFASESATMGLARDDVRVDWFPPGSCVIEQGEPADALYLVLSGSADVLLEQPDGHVTHLSRMKAGDFFGELDLMTGARTSHVLARESLTCLVLSRAPMRPYAGRGAGAPPAAGPAGVSVPPGFCAVDVTDNLQHKLRALARHRTQYPVVPSMLPRRLLQRMLGTEFFLPAASINRSTVLGRFAPVVRGRLLPWTPGAIGGPVLTYLKSSLAKSRYLKPGGLGRTG